MKRRISWLWNRLNITARSMLAVVMSFIVATLVALGFSAYYAAVDARIALTSEYEQGIAHLEPLIISALNDHDGQRLNDAFESIRHNPAMVHVGFRDVSDIFDHVSETVPILTAPSWFAKLCENQHMKGQHRLTANGVYYGLLTLDLSPIPSINLAWVRTRQQITVLALALGIAFVSIWLVLRNSLRPLHDLRKGTKVLSDGDYSFRLKTQGSPELRDNIIGFNRMANVLEQAQKRNEETLVNISNQLQQQSRFANALLNAQASAGVCLAIFNDGKVISANKAALEVVGMKQEDLAKIRVSTIIDPDYINEFDYHYLRVQRGETILSPRVEVKLAIPDGKECWLEVAFFGISRNNTYLVAVLGLDITQRKRDTQKLMMAHEILRTQKDEAEHANEAKTRFLAAVSHDLRQPLLALMLFCERLRDLVTTPEQQHLAGQISDAGGNLSELLESLLDISKIDLATLLPDIRPIDLEELLRRVAAQHRHNAEAKQLRLHVARTSLWIASDPDLFFRIVANLVSNAIRYTERGSVVIGARRAGDQVRVEIWDTGIGIEEKHFPQLFQEFYQVVNSERNANNGLGLGLAIVDRLARILDHKISLRSIRGSGSVFCVLAPRATREHNVLDAQLTEHAGGSILLATDGNKRQTRLAQMLSSWGYGVTVCRKNEMNKERIEAAAPDLILNDLPCSRCLDQGHDTLLPGEIPVICIKEEKASSCSRDVQHLCSTLDASAKPAKLRALILHLLTEKGRDEREPECERG